MDASTLISQWLERLPPWASGQWAPLISTAAALLVLSLLWRLLRRSPADAEANYDVSGDRFAYTAPINEDQIELLHYLQKAFPEGAVLYRPRLARFLAVRKTQQRLLAQQRLARTQVDFLICGEDGKPLFAFEVDAFKDRDDPRHARHLADKNLMLKTAGIRLIRLKGAASSLPPPELLRLRMLSAQRTPAPDTEARPSGFGLSVFDSSRFEHPEFASSRQHGSDTMSLSRLMGSDRGDNAWSGVRKRS